MASPAWTVPPVTLPGGKPVVAAPGLTPKSPVMIVGPELVTTEARRTARGTVFFIWKLLGWISLHCRRQGGARVVEPTLSSLLNTLEADKPRVICKGFQYLDF